MPFPFPLPTRTPNPPHLKCLLLLAVCLLANPPVESLDRAKFRSEFFDYGLNNYQTDGSDYYKYLTSSFNSIFDKAKRKPSSFFVCEKDSDCSSDGTKRCLNGECIRLNCPGCKYSHCEGKASFVSTDEVGNFIQTNNFPELGRYLSSAKCSWILRNLNSGKFLDINRNIQSVFPPFIQLEIERFSTDFGNDYMYIFGGDSIYSPLIAAFR